MTELAITFDAFVYGWRNIETGLMYIGFHKNSDVNDGYTFSSEDPELKREWSMGKLHRSILYRGDQTTAITMERKLLKYADARRSSKFYNKSNGGGVGILDYTTITDEQAKVGIDWINGIDPVETFDMFDLVDLDLVDDILQSVKDGKYEVHEISASIIASFAHNQVRLIMIDQKHLRDITQHLLDTKDARQHISPIIACVTKDGTIYIIDGNHTAKAVLAADWVSAPVIFINSSEFLDRQSNIDHFGIIANHNPKIKKPNSTEDCQRAIINLYSRNLKDKDDAQFTLLDSAKFKTTCEQILYPNWTKSQISSNLTYAKNRIKTHAAEAELNFQTYGKPDLDFLVKQVQNKFPDLSIITVSTGSVYNAGVGGIMNKMGTMDVWAGLIITHHGGITEYESWEDSKIKLTNAMKRMHPDCDVKYIVLDSFKKQTTIEI